MIIKKNIKQYLFKFFLISILILLFFFFSYRIETVPPGLNGDEASIGFNAILLSRTLRDENNRFLPLFIQTLNKTDWKQPVTVYTTAAFFKIFGPSYFLLRAVSIFSILLSCIFIFLIIKQIIDINFALLGVIIFASSPVILIQSHLALENIAPLPFVILWLLMIIKYIKLEKNIYLLLAGLFLGMSFYSYNGMRLTMPVIVLITHCFLFLEKKPKRTGIFFLFGWLPFILVLPLVKSIYPGSLFGSARPVEIHSIQDFIYPYLSSFDISFLFFKGDSTPYHSTGRYGLFLLATLPGFLVGIYQSFKQKNHFLILSLITFFLTPLLFGWVGSIFRGSRLLTLVPFYTIIATYGYYLLWQLKKNYTKVLFLAIIFVFGIFSYQDFVKDYWFEYPKRVKENFTSDAHLSYPALKLASEKLNLKPMIETGVSFRENISGKFFELSYFPKPIELWNIIDDPPSGDYIILATSNLTKLLNSNFKQYTLATERYSLYYLDD